MRIDKERVAAEGATETARGFFNGLGFIGALIAVPFVIAHALFIAPFVALFLAIHKFPHLFNRREAEKSARAVAEWVNPKR